MVALVLLERVENLGQIGDVVNVRPGYARNYLLPQKKALRATKANLEAFEGRKAQILADNLKRKEEAEAAAVKMDGLKLALVRQAGESGQLYGSVNGRDVAEATATAGFTINRNQVVIEKPIKTTGVHTVRVSLHPEVSVSVVIAVAQTKDEADALLAGRNLRAEAAADEAADEAALAAELAASAAAREAEDA